MLGILFWNRLSHLPKPHLNYFRKMQGMSTGFLGDLFAAAKPVGNDEGFGTRVADGGQQLKFANFARDLVLIVLESEGAGHATASWGGRIEIEAHPGQDRFLGIHFHDGLVVAVSVNQCFSGDARKLKIFCVAFEELAQQECLLRKRTGTDVIRKEIDQFVAKDGNAARLKSYDRNTGFDFRQQGVEDLKQLRFGPVEHADVIERTPAAQIPLG